jgi:hypothetical protein
MSWVRLSTSTLDLGGDPRGSTRTVWLYADAYRVLGVHRGAFPADIKRAYRRLVRLHHPDVNLAEPGAVERFRDIHDAYSAIVDSPEVSVDPESGDWWDVVSIAEGGFGPSFAIGITFQAYGDELDELAPASDRVRIGYAGQSVTLTLTRTAPAAGTAARLARIGALLEPVLLVGICLGAAPILAACAAFSTFFLSEGNVTLAAVVAVGCLAGVIAGLAAVLTRPGRPFQVWHQLRSALRV